MKRNIFYIFYIFSLLISGCSASHINLSEPELVQAAQQGQGKAQYELANRLAAKPDYPEAMRWMKQVAEQNGPLAVDADIRGKAALQVGSWYQAGLGEPKNPRQASGWWQRSAKLGNPDVSY